MIFVGRSDISVDLLACLRAGVAVLGAPVTESELDGNNFINQAICSDSQKPTFPSARHSEFLPPSPLLPVYAR